MLPGYFNIRSLPHAIFIPTWLNLASFWLQKPTKITSWSVFGHLGRVLERLGLILERLGGVLERFGRVLGRLGAKNSVLRRLGRVLNSIMLRAESRADRIAAPLGRWEQTIIKEKKDLLQKNCRPLQTIFLWTLTRSWAPSGPVRIQRTAELRSRHRA